jgi:hypothetical protein
MTKVKNTIYEAVPDKEAGIGYRDTDGAFYHLFVEKAIGGDYRFRLVKQDD